MAGLGRFWEIWALPFHTFVALRGEYLDIVRGEEPESEVESSTEIMPGVMLETVPHVE